MGYYVSSKGIPKVGLVAGYETKGQYFVVVVVLNRWIFGEES